MFDIGANLTSSHFLKDLDVVLNDSLTAGVEKICITSSNLDDVTQIFSMPALSDSLITASRSFEK